MMNLLGIRFCSVNEQAQEMLDFFQKGLSLKNTFESNQEFTGGVFPVGESDSWVEVWKASEQMPEGIMLQLVVEDADRVAENAREAGLHPQGPMDAHGERIYYLQAPSGLSVSFQSRLTSTD
ncbi:hypothetical protein [Aliikangiella coralliicola]|uniref:VOC domain-containing protein n=1 Tax=Aliikangiella coralliicola TaxID=2592383 RepID=A0A545TW59_9GAMM|nr:hypothetical protein [Aliikangiella coralliicola]TQV81434.1 hypothetical protein FLL46_25115 [Aliikangiella coralliicola]